MKTSSPGRRAKNVRNQYAIFEISLKVLFRNTKGEVLILKANEASSMNGYYDFVGGRMNEKERNGSFLKAMRREITEEIGSKVRYTLNERPVAISRHTYRSPRTGITHHVFWVIFEAEYKGGTIQLSREHIDFQWITLTKNVLRKYFIKGPYEAARYYLSGKFK